MVNQKGEKKKDTKTEEWNRRSKYLIKCMKRPTDPAQMLYIIKRRWNVFICFNPGMSRSFTLILRSKFLSYALHALFGDDQ